jgi:hypothetical protein
MTPIEIDPAPIRLEDVLDPAWFDAALRDEGLPGPVVGAEVVERIETVATKLRVAVTCRLPDGGTERRPYFVKGYFDDPTRFAAGAPEAGFYRSVAPTLDVRSPRCAYVGVDPDTDHTVLVLDDLVAAGCRFLSALSPYSPAEAAVSLGQLALLHAGTWGRGDIAAATWLRPSPAVHLPASFPPETLQERLSDGRTDGLPPPQSDAGAVIAALGRLGEDPGLCLVHGDTHAGNLYVDPDGRPSFTDWQIVHFGHWATDVAYHIASVLPVDDRRRHERDLLAGYLDALGRAGGEPPGWDEAWAAYRSHLVYGYYLWAVTIYTPRPIVLEFVARLGTALADHGTLAA